MLCLGQAVSISLLLLSSPEKASNPDYCNRKKKKYKEEGQPPLSVCVLELEVLGLPSSIHFPGRETELQLETHTKSLWLKSELGNCSSEHGVFSFILSLAKIHYIVLSNISFQITFTRRDKSVFSNSEDGGLKLFLKHAFKVEVFCHELFFYIF